MNILKNITASILIIAGCSNAMAQVVVPPNPEKTPVKAFNYVYNIAVNKNVADEWAQYLLGKYYESGYGTKKDLDKAFVWYSLSTDHDYQPAVAALKKLKKIMPTSQIKKDEALTIKTRNASVEKAMAYIKSQVGY